MESEISQINRSSCPLGLDLTFLETNRISNQISLHGFKPASIVLIMKSFKGGPIQRGKGNNYYLSCVIDYLVIKGPRENI